MSPGPWCRLLRRQEGGFALEVGIMLPALLLILSGIVDLGQALYMQRVIASASREGARYAVKYQTDGSGNRILPNALNPSLSDYILKTSAQNSGKGGIGLASRLPGDANPYLVLSDLTDAAKSPGYTTGTAGQAITVTVAATKTWLFLHNFIPGWSNQLTLSASTVMTCE